MGKYLRISYHTAGKTIPLFNLLLRYKIFLNYFMAFGILAILRHHREIINISWWHVISRCTAFYFLRTTGYFLRNTGKRDTSSPSNNKFQACKAKENISAKLRQNIGQESLLIAALSTLFKPRFLWGGANCLRFKRQDCLCNESWGYTECCLMLN